MSSVQTPNGGLRWRLVRDVALFCLGAGGLITLLAVWVVTGRPPDEILAAIFAGMAGLPLALHKDER